MPLTTGSPGLRRHSYQYFRDVPLPRLTFLLLAIFCLFGMVGFLIDVTELGRKPVVEVLVWTLFTGGMAVFYLLTLIRSPRWFLLPVAVHLLGSKLIRGMVLPQGHDYLSRAIDESGIRMAAMASLALSMLAGLLFLQFIRSEGRRSVRLQTELSLAHGIQQTLVPVIDRTLKHCEIYGVSLPSDNVGGDLVDAVELQNGQTIAYVADIAGHGLPAGILMAMLKTAARTQFFDLPRLPAFFERLNQVLPEVKQPEMYATCAAILLKRSEGSLFLEYSSAGHPPILYIAHGSGQVERLQDPQFPLGLMGGVVFMSHEIKTQPGDLFLIATDGIIETVNQQGDDFGLERIETILLANIFEPLPVIANHLQESVRGFGKQADDQTIFLLRVR
jgi:serine phosphatase RsbU (regulator of sigma subunit)